MRMEAIARYRPWLLPKFAELPSVTDVPAGLLPRKMGNVRFYPVEDGQVVAIRTKP